MNTPVVDFVKRYIESDTVRLHMPGHKGKSFLGCESWDITEVKGADALFEAEGILAQSEENATNLFGSRRTCYSTEGSSHCIRAMLYLAVTNRPAGASPTVVAARNVHRAFVSAAALLDLDVEWLWPEESRSLCGCPVTPESLDRMLSALPSPPAAVYLTSPDYLGGMAELSSLAEVCHRHRTLLAVDNAHGSYLRFLEPSLHPLDLGADLCCDSAHKTLPVLTGGAYLHISKSAPHGLEEHVKTALALFGSTSPSYLTLCSLDLCNRYLAEGYPARLQGAISQLKLLKVKLKNLGWQVEESDPLRVTLKAPQGTTGQELAERLRLGGVECEYADRDFLVLMATPENTPEELEQALTALGRNQAPPTNTPFLPLAKGKRVCSIRQALFSPHQLIPSREALGRTCAAPTVGCPPAVPIAVAGEEIGPEALELFQYYNVSTVDVLK
ncbi:putative pyridoxal phosphate-dependent transferase [Clostridium sp. CAG:1013]|nr:putative pyridoxal phosphate-dependent transferase [Clostridium sp. CAG:1013]